MGRLSCQPGELFYPRQFAVHDLAELAAPRLLNLLERCGEVLPAWLRHNLQQLWHVEFIARPMQVRASFQASWCCPASAWKNSADGRERIQLCGIPTLPCILLFCPGWCIYILMSSTGHLHSLGQMLAF